ncbi:redoxin domain-containing protein [Auraticoccus monumenti]|uniref:Peroxiredoxin n=1 Tax=Auraticoccus monumenti TaxID=675864 RepID=A0A1G7E747_9ACTN|nr:redoxin domain-containing protein [Auraticoccus monumenti]SDE59439.1 Peroxiredoxin [Auraticoccus monumenti]
MRAADGVPALRPEAPDFTTRDQHGREHTLSALRGSPVLLVFYPWANTPVCASELVALQQRLGRYAEAGAHVRALSCDSIFSLRAFADALSLSLPLLSDHWPHGAIARCYEVFDEELGCARRTSVWVDAAGRVAWRDGTAHGTARDPDAPLEALSRL